MRTTPLSRNGRSATGAFNLSSKEMTTYSFVDQDGRATGKRTQPAPQELWQRYHQTGDASVENALVEQYLPLVRTVVGRVAMTLPAHVSADDLNSAGLVGLLQAVRNFSSSGGASFETFARFRIRGAVLDELRRLDWVPRLVHDKARKIQNVMGELEQRLGKPPTEDQMALALGISLEDYRGWLDDIRPIIFISLDAAPRSEGPEGATPHDSIADDSQDDPAESASRSELNELIAQRIQQLPQTQQKVMALYYFEDLRLREIAEAFGLTESRISQIHSQAILAIRSFIERQEAIALQRGGGNHP
jgi:RNA polymerase sigma factor FliA